MIDNMQRWNSDSFCLRHRIDCIKKNILPWQIFLFQAVEIPSEQFLNWTRSFSDLFGRERNRDLNLKHCNKEQGGMVLPHFKDYYYQAQIKPLINMCILSFHARLKDRTFHNE